MAPDEQIRMLVTNLHPPLQTRHPHRTCSLVRAIFVCAWARGEQMLAVTTRLAPSFTKEAISSDLLPPLGAAALAHRCRMSMPLRRRHIPQLGDDLGKQLVLCTLRLKELQPGRVFACTCVGNCRSCTGRCPAPLQPWMQPLKNALTEARGRGQQLENGAYPTVLGVTVGHTVEGALHSPSCPYNQECSRSRSSNGSKGTQLLRRYVGSPSCAHTVLNAAECHVSGSMATRGTMRTSLFAARTRFTQSLSTSCPPLTAYSSSPLRKTKPHRKCIHAIEA